MLKNKNKVRGEIKLVDKKEEDPLESIRTYILINEDAKKSYDEYVAKTKQRGENMKNLMREAEAKYHPVRGELKLVDKKEEDPLESIRRFNLINEDAKKSYDEYVAKTKQRGENMKNLMREVEAKYHPVRGEIKLVDKKEEDSLESIRRFNLINEDAKKSYDEYVAKTKQRGEDMKSLMREAEAKYHPDLDQSKDIDVDSDPLSGLSVKNVMKN